MIKMEYVGKIPELQGKLAVVRPLERNDYPLHRMNSSIRMAKFDEKIDLDGRRLDLYWHPFEQRDFKATKEGKRYF